MSGKVGPGALAGAATGLAKFNSDSILDQPPAARKRKRVLAALLNGQVTTFQAEKAPIFDHCLPSTVSELRKTGLSITSERIQVEGYRGQPAYIARYTLADASRAKALQMLGAGK